MFSEVAAAMLGKVGMNVDDQVMDTATWARRLKTAPRGGKLQPPPLFAASYSTPMNPISASAAVAYMQSRTKEAKPWSTSEPRERLRSATGL